MLYRRSNLIFILLLLLLPAWAGPSAQQLLYEQISGQQKQRTKSLKKTSMSPTLLAAVKLRYILADSALSNFLFVYKQGSK